MSMRKILGCLKQADIDYDLIKDGDKIAVGISGGKDSFVLLEALNLYKFFSKKKYEIVGINIIMGFPNMKFFEIRKWCKNNNIEFHQIKSKPLIYDVLKLNKTKDGKLPCSICSKMKKAAINQAAKKYKCNKVAFAHHSDDAIETLFLNMTHGGRIATFSPKMFLSNEKMTFIRPLVYCHEKDIAKTALQNKLPLCISTCPNDKNTNREEIKLLLKKYYHLFPQARNNFLTMLSNTSKIDIWQKKYPDDYSFIKNSKKHLLENKLNNVENISFTRDDKFGKKIAGLNATIEDNILQINDVFVSQDFYNKNIEKELYYDVEKYAKTKNISIIILNIYSFQNHKAFEEMGFIKFSSFNGKNYNKLFYKKLI
ncbi:MAG: ATP-binding protein [Bacilli bacterium]